MGGQPNATHDHLTARGWGRGWKGFARETAVPGMPHGAAEARAERAPGPQPAIGDEIAPSRRVSICAHGPTERAVGAEGAAASPPDRPAVAAHRPKLSY
jgi:hypothetical protein